MLLGGLGKQSRSIADQAELSGYCSYDWNN